MRWKRHICRHIGQKLFLSMKDKYKFLGSAEDYLHFQGPIECGFLSYVKVNYRYNYTYRGIHKPE